MKNSYKLLLLLCLTVTVASAENDYHYKPGEYYFAPGVAYYHFSSKRDLENSAMANISVGKVISEQWSIEAFYGQAATEELPSSLDQSTRFYTYAADGIYHFSSDANAVIHPYALAGLNMTKQEDDSPSAGNTTLLGANAGLGIEYFVNSNISLFADARDLYTFSGGKNDWMLNGGIKFIFGINDTEETAVVTDPPITTEGPTGFYQLQEPVQNNSQGEVKR